MMMTKSKFPMMSLTEAAAQRIRDILRHSDHPDRLLKIGLRKGGCAGMAYTMDFVEERQPGDELVEDKGVRFLVDSKAVLFLIGTRMDFTRGKLSSGFVFDNPNQTSACGCGESVSIAPRHDFMPFSEH